MASNGKKRKMNFSEREVEIIVEEIEKQKHILVHTHIVKNNAWIEIPKKVNAVTTCPKELAEVKKKWSDMKTEVAQARAAIEDTTTDCTSVPVILTAMQQRICNLLGEATIISLPAGDPNAEITLPVTMSSVTTVTLTESLQTASASCEETKSLDVETTYHTLEEGGNVHVRQIAQHLEGQNQLLQMIRRSQEAQAYAQERQAQALECTQAALLALVQMMRPALKDPRKFLQSGTDNSNNSGTLAEGAQ
ncbi:nuclear apoptosis-inducing factor 1-like [Oncorhynchus clarkii lewisi]|uniref:nuclear apoptosis-inducing factor 1-like n=1 Tax=Oncorhynchus clarkii lewisi TaxID=490388 RepID=UPI0039B85EA7